MSIAHILANEASDSTLAKRMEQIDISLLTCQPRDEIYALYGHTAIRVRDRALGRDIVVNYGVFDFRARFFVARFIFGLTDYMMGICSYEDFVGEWNTGVYEQRINMTAGEKARFLELLAINNEPENVVYRYNYFHDNCATRARNIIFDSFEDGKVDYSPLTSWQQGERSFRQLVHSRNADHPWARLGNDLLLGVGADANTSHAERQFLPDVLCADFDSASVVYADGSRKRLVERGHWLTPPAESDRSSGVSPPWEPTPTGAAIVVACAILALCVVERFIVHRQLVWGRRIVLVAYGMPGVILLLMLFSQHPTVSLNLQILTLNPLWLVIAFPLPRFKYRWHVVCVCLVAFFAGAFVQDYAEGVTILALGLFFLAMNALMPMGKAYTSSR